MRKLLATTGLLVVFPATVMAAIIDNGTIQLGVDDFGQLNVPGGAPSAVDGTTEVGLRYLPTGNEATSHGCVCEGWGVGIGDTLDSGSANNDFGGADGLSLDSFTSTATTATSVVDLDSGALRVTHHFAPAPETPDLYRVSVSIENTSGADIADLRYTRTFDWDIEPETFSEAVTIGGTAGTPSVLLAIDNGFVDSDPFAGRSEIYPGGTGDFTDLVGPDPDDSDHGANFDFGFGALADGETFSFEIFYGASGTEVEAFAALAAVSAEVYSFGQVFSDPGGTGATSSNGYPTNTFIFGFAGVGGTVVVPPEIPLPAPALLLLTGLGAMGGRRVLRRKG